MLYSTKRNAYVPAIVSCSFGMSDSSNKLDSKVVLSSAPIQSTVQSLVFNKWRAAELKAEPLNGTEAELCAHI